MPSQGKARERPLRPVPIQAEWGCSIATPAQRHFPNERRDIPSAASHHRRPSCVFDDRLKPRAALPLRGCLAPGLSPCRTFGALELSCSSVADGSGFSLMVPRGNDEAANHRQFSSPNGDYPGSPRVQRASASNPWSYESDRIRTTGADEMPLLETARERTHRLASILI